MQIFTLDDVDFPALLKEFDQGHLIGKYYRSGQMLLVHVNPHYIFIADGQQPTHIAVKPARDLQEAQSFALEYLHRELRRGNPVEIATDLA